MCHSPNRSLNAHPQEVFAAIEPHLQQLKLSFAGLVAETDKSIAQVYLSFGGVVDWTGRHALDR